MLPNPSTLDQSPEFFNALCARIGKSQYWIADHSGISRRRILYLAAGSRVINGEQKAVKLSFPEQFILEYLADPNLYIPEK
jgi:hypothetical protein